MYVTFVLAGGVLGILVVDRFSRCTDSVVYRQKEKKCLFLKIYRQNVQKIYCLYVKNVTLLVRPVAVNLLIYSFAVLKYL